MVDVLKSSSRNRLNSVIVSFVLSSWSTCAPSSLPKADAFSTGKKINLSSQPRASTTLHVLFPQKRGIIVEATDSFVAKDPLLDEYLGREPTSYAKASSSASNPSTSFDNGTVQSLPNPNEMKVREIQAELKQRNIPYADCFDRESLTKRLMEARG